MRQRGQCRSFRSRSPSTILNGIFELKHDGFRALAYIDRYECTLLSRRRHVYKQFPMLETELAHAVRARSCILDGEIVALAPDGRSKSYDLLCHREWPHFIAFDVPRDQ